MSRAAYEIHVVGHVPARLLEDFERVTVSPDLAGATLRAELADQAELHGLLDALRRDGLTLVDVRREQPYAQTESPGATEGDSSVPDPPP
jgi:hypothetical protein